MSAPVVSLGLDGGLDALTGDSVAWSTEQEIVVRDAEEIGQMPIEIRDAGVMNEGVDVDVSMHDSQDLAVTLGHTAVWSPGAASRMLLHDAPANAPSHLMHVDAESRTDQDGVVKTPIVDVHARLASMTSLPPIAPQMPLPSSPIPSSPIPPYRLDALKKEDIDLVAQGELLTEQSQLDALKKEDIDPIVAQGELLTEQSQNGTISPIRLVNPLSNLAPVVIGALPVDCTPDAEFQHVKDVIVHPEEDAVLDPAFRSGERMRLSRQRGRSSITQEQLEYLEEKLRAGALDQETELLAIASHLDLPLARVKNWFFNNHHRCGRGHRMSSPASRSPGKQATADKGDKDELKTNKPNATGVVKARRMQKKAARVKRPSPMAVSARTLKAGKPLRKGSGLSPPSRRVTARQHSQPKQSQPQQQLERKQEGLSNLQQQPSAAVSPATAALVVATDPAAGPAPPTGLPQQQQATSPGPADPATAHEKSPAKEAKAVNGQKPPKSPVSAAAKAAAANGSEQQQAAKVKATTKDAAEVAQVLDRGDGKRRIKKSTRVLEEEERIADDAPAKLSAPFAASSKPAAEQANKPAHANGKQLNHANHNGKANHAQHNGKATAHANCKGTQGNQPAENTAAANGAAAHPVKRRHLAHKDKDKDRASEEGPSKRQQRGPKLGQKTARPNSAGSRKNESAAKDDDDEEGCAVCGLDDNHVKMLLCDRCDAEYHMHCLTPRVQRVPRSEWFCPHCVSSQHQPPLKRRRKSVDPPEQQAEEEEELTPLRPDSFCALPAPLQRHLTPGPHGPPRGRRPNNSNRKVNKPDRMLLVRSGTGQGPSSFFAAFFRALNCAHPKFLHSTDLPSTETLFADMEPKEQMQRAKEWRLWLSRRAGQSWFMQQCEAVTPAANAAHDNASFEAWQRRYKNFGLPADKLIMQHAASYFNVNLLVVRLQPRDKLDAHNQNSHLNHAAAQSPRHVNGNGAIHTRGRTRGASKPAPNAQGKDKANRKERKEPQLCVFRPCVEAGSRELAGEPASNVMLLQLEPEDADQTSPEQNGQQPACCPAGLCALGQPSTHPGPFFPGSSHPAALLGPEGNHASCPHSLDKDMADWLLSSHPASWLASSPANALDSQSEGQSHFEAILRYPQLNGRSNSRDWDDNNSNTSFVVDALEGVFASDDPLIQHVLTRLG
eukprot:g73804.t1